MRSKIQFFYDVASPYSYLAAHRILTLTDEVQFEWCPILLGGIFKATGNTSPALLPARAQYIIHDLERWAQRHGTPFTYSSSFPHHSLVAMRALTAVDDSDRVALSMKVFRAAWVDNLDISQVDVLVHIFGDRAERILKETQNPVVKNALKAMTQRAIDQGAFGAPSFVVDGALYWGNDRLDMVIDRARSGTE
ncbi:MAG: 2-hydroxychromene-2-carboxylate isomerase [Myxococcota bacterium]|nr:2-hydroxychromene-2-carboxylate isomerase [Myxococcota bacterium]